MTTNVDARQDQSGRAHREVRTARREIADHWWWFLLTGIAWIVFSLMVLQFDLGSVAAIGYLAGGVVILAGVNEALSAWAAREWRWLHLLLALSFGFIGVLALVWPGRTFEVIANLVAWFLLFRGTLDLIVAFAARGEDLWWARLVAGIINIVLAFWAAGYTGRSAALLVLWVGLSCLARGITELVTAFQLRGMRADIAPSPS